jgi:PHD/YefM family antitoxin component YafN of YafNO toxin-antitoxin module
VTVTSRNVRCRTQFEPFELSGATLAVAPQYLYIRDMQKFSTVDLDQRLGDVKAAAARAPVVITEHRKERFVMMHVDEYKELQAMANPRRVYATSKTPKRLAKLFQKEIDRILSEKD